MVASPARRAKKKPQAAARLATDLPYAARASQIAHDVQPIEAGGAYDLSGVLDAWPRTTDATRCYCRVSPWRAPLSLSAASIPSRRALI
jgi:hypothetical protein